MANSISIEVLEGKYQSQIKVAKQEDIAEVLANVNSNSYFELRELFERIFKQKVEWDLWLTLPPQQSLIVFFSNAPISQLYDVIKYQYLKLSL